MTTIQTIMWRENASLQYFAKNWMVPTGQNLKEEYAKIRVWNYLIENVEPRMAQISGTEEDKNIIWEKAISSVP